jgi:hypothetical protein
MPRCGFNQSVIQDWRELNTSLHITLHSLTDKELDGYTFTMTQIDLAIEHPCFEFEGAWLSLELVLKECDHSTYII